MLAEVKDYFHLSPMRGMHDVAILNRMCSCMGYPHTEHPSKSYSDAKLDLPPFDTDHRIFSSFLVVELGESIKLTIR